MKWVADGFSQNFWDIVKATKADKSTNRDKSAPTGGGMVLPEQSFGSYTLYIVL